MRTDKPLPTDTRSVRRASGFVLVGDPEKGLLGGPLRRHSTSGASTGQSRTHPSFGALTAKSKGT